MKDSLVAYVVHCEDLGFEIGSEAIAEWSTRQSLPGLAIKFIEAAKEKGAVLTLTELEYELNRGNGVGTDDYVFITEKQ